MNAATMQHSTTTNVYNTEEECLNARSTIIKYNEQYYKSKNQRFEYIIITDCTRNETDKAPII